jgi:hypothetical protein
MDYLNGQSKGKHRSYQCWQEEVAYLEQGKSMPALAERNLWSGIS